jgi:hypothetical protein
MNEFSTFSAGVAGATADLALGPVMAGGPTEKLVPVTLDYIVSEFRSRLGCSDSYLAGYLSVIFAEKPVTALDLMNSAKSSLESASACSFELRDYDLSEKLDELVVYLESEIECEITGVFPDYD